MIYTCTLNPSIDYTMTIDNLKLGELNRVNQEIYKPGGKGINVSIVLNNLGISSQLYGFLGGFTGDFINNELKKLKHIKPDFIKVEGNTRINVKLKGSAETELNANGPQILISDYQKLINRIKKIKKDDVFILSGSVPSTITNSVYEEIAEIVTNKKALLIVDSNNHLLLSTLKYKPFLIKPNKKELEEIFNVSLSSDSDIYKYAYKLKEQGAQNVLVSLGKNGSMLITDEEIYRSFAPKGEVVNTVGAGDSMVAGFLSEYLKTRTYYNALKMASACGSATAFSKGLAQQEMINTIKESINIEIYKEDD